MTNSEKIINAIDERKALYAEYLKNPSAEGWRAVNDAGNNMYAFVKTCPLTRAEYEAMLGGENLREDNAIYCCESSWWNSDDRDALIWSYAHVGRQAALQIERGKYVPPTDAMLGL